MSTDNTAGEKPTDSTADSTDDHDHSRTTRRRALADCSRFDLAVLAATAQDRPTGVEVIRRVRDRYETTVSEHRIRTTLGRLEGWGLVEGGLCPTDQRATAYDVTTLGLEVLADEAGWLAGAVPGLAVEDVTTDEDRATVEQRCGVSLREGETRDRSGHADAVAAQLDVDGAREALEAYRNGGEGE
jgi:DNA-binding PadR family transcriptional regulator